MSSEGQARINDGLVSDRDLAVVIDAWPALPEPLKAGILAMVKAASGKGGGR